MLPTLLPWKCYVLVSVCRVFLHNTTDLQTYLCRLPRSRQRHQCQAVSLRYSKQQETVYNQMRPDILLSFRVTIQSPKNLMQPFPLPDDALLERAMCIKGQI